MLKIGANDELGRLFPSVGMHIVHAQFRLSRLHEIRASDYRAIADAVAARDPKRARRAAERHVERIREMIEAMGA